MTRQKLPAYAHALIAQRREGRHPSRVHVAYGGDWQAVPAPRLAVKPGEALGLDWRCVAGLPVVVVDRAQLAPVARFEDELAPLAAEVAAHAAQVTVDSPFLLGRLGEIGEIAFCMRRRADGRVVWPEWWPEEIRKTHERHKRRWEDEALRVIGRRLERAA